MENLNLLSLEPVVLTTKTDTDLAACTVFEGCSCGSANGCGAGGDCDCGSENGGGS